MRLFLIVLVFAVIGYVFTVQKSTEATAQAENARKPQAAASAVPSAATWPKRSLDRANEVAREVRKQRQENQQP